MEVRLTAREWAKEIENKFTLFFELFNDEYSLDVHARAHGNNIVLFIKEPEGIDLKEKRNAVAVRSALNMATRGCPYEFSYRLEK